MPPKPRLSFWQIWNISFGFLGIQFGWALQAANLSRIFQTLGAEIDDIAILWIAAPVTGLLVQPIIGHMSDRTWNRLGRRRPFFLVGAVLASAALIVMPNSTALWMAAGLLWILDASINISMEPFRAFVGDMLPSEQRTKGFAMQSFFIGTGSVVASLFPWMMTNWFGVANTAAPGQIPAAVTISFYVGAAVFLGAVLWTVFRVQEYSPEQMAAFEKADAASAPPDHDFLPAERYRTGMPGWLLAGVILTATVWYTGLEKELYILGVGLIAYGLLLFLASALTARGHRGGFVEVMSDLIQMPDMMKRLAWVQFFSWFALFSMFLYATPAITSHIYGTTDTTSQIYNDGADWVGVLFGAYNAVAALIAFGLPVMAKATSRRATHIIGLVAGGLGLASIFVIPNPTALLISMVGVGIAWASVLAMPYAILTDHLPARKFGIYMGIFNFFIVLPQITASTVYGMLLENVYGGESIYVLITGGVAFFIAALLMLRVREP